MGYRTWSVMYPESIMRKDDPQTIGSEILMEVLLTCDGRGKEQKKKALDILLQRRYGEGLKDEANLMRAQMNGEIA